MRNAGEQTTSTDVAEKHRKTAENISATLVRLSKIDSEVKTVMKASHSLEALSTSSNET